MLLFGGPNSSSEHRTNPAGAEGGGAEFGSCSYSHQGKKSKKTIFLLTLEMAPLPSPL
jgi:hypothetical protein